MRVLGIIPARGGSKGIARKNLIDVAGKPLIAYTIEAAQAAERLIDWIVSTEDEEIAEVSRRLGAKVPFLRPAELARDDTPTIPVLQDAVRRIELDRSEYDAVLTLQPTNPLRIAGDIDGAIELLESSGADSVISFAPVGERHPARMKLIEVDGVVRDPGFAEQFEGQPRQQLPPLYLRDGSIYLTRRDVLMKHHSLKGNDCRAWIIPAVRARNIDEPLDVFLVSKLLQLGPANFPGRAFSIPDTSMSATTSKTPFDAGAFGSRQFHEAVTLPSPNTRLAAPTGTKARPRLLIAEGNNFSPDAIKILGTHFDVEVADLDRAELLERIPLCDVLWVRLRNKIDAEIMDRAPRLSAIATNTTGLNHIDVKEAERRGIPIISLKGESEFLKDIRATAEHTIGLTLALLRKIPAAHRDVCRGRWDRDRFVGREVFGKTVGIIGYGRLGKIVAGYFSALGADVLISSRELTPNTLVDGYPVKNLAELLQSSDIVSLHVNYEPMNGGMIGAMQFANMKRGAFFINTARGELVDEGALINSVRSGHLSGAAIDVRSNESELDTNATSLLAACKQSDDLNIIVTPHIGGATIESSSKTEVYLAYKCCRLLWADSERRHGIKYCQRREF